jgi:surfactin synthase thioesterase subunit/phosphopantetheinyl transferase
MVPTRQPQLFCLPYAGGGASAYWSWRHAFGDSVDVQPVQLPGREGRIAERLELSPAAIAAELAARAAPPYALYGHSMGARLAFEVARELRRRGQPLPERIYVGAAHPPHVPPPLAKAADLPDDAFIDVLITRAGAPTELRDEPELRELMLPVLRADFGWLKRYRYLADPPLPVPIVAFAGAHDPEVAPRDMLGWARHTAAGFRLHTLVGGHFFLRDAAEQLARLLTADLQPDDAPLDAPADDEVHVWLAALDDLPGACAAVDELSPNEARRAAAFHGEQDRRRYVGRCVVLRRLLRRYGVDVGAAELPTRRNGKPELADSDLAFSLSHSAGLALIALAWERDIGADVERVRPVADLDALCEGALDAGERAELAGVAEDERLGVALRVWTAKEAILKATGDGLRVEPSQFGFRDLTAPPGRPWRARAQGGLERLTRWRVTHLPLDGAIGAVALLLDDWRLRLETVRDGAW